MKKLFFLGLFMFPVAVLAQTPQMGEVSREVRKADNFNSDAVYQSSQSCAGSTNQSVFISSPFPAGLFAIDVTSPAPGSYIEVWDGSPSTANARRVAYINSAIVGEHFFSVSFSSWLGVSNQPVTGGVTPCISTIYRVR